MKLNEKQWILKSDCTWHHNGNNDKYYLFMALTEIIVLSCLTAKILHAMLYIDRTYNLHVGCVSDGCGALRCADATV